MQNQPEYKDITFICKDCGQPWVFTISEQKLYVSKGLKIPLRCPQCRAERKATINRDEGRRYG